MEKRAKTQPKPESDETQREDQPSPQPGLSSTSTNQGTSTQDRLASPALPRPYCPEADQDRASFPGTAMTSSGLLWHMAWCPLLQGMARMCCDVRRSVRQTAITYLQRALLAHGLQSLSAQEWEACFLEVRVLVCNWTSTLHVLVQERVNSHLSALLHSEGPVK